MPQTTERHSSNPAFAYVNFQRADTSEVAPATVSIEGVALKTLFYIAILCATGAWAWAQAWPYLSQVAVEGAGNTTIPGPVLGYAIGGTLGAFIVAMFTIFIPSIARYTAPVYSALEGLALGTISVCCEAAYPGIIMNAVISTVGVFAVVTFFYGTGVIKVTETFKSVILSAMFGIFIVYMADILIRLFGGPALPMIHQQGSWLAIGFSVLVIIVAGLSFAWDFQNVKDAQEAGAPKYFEAYLAFGLMLTLVWLYVEVLRLWILLQGKKD